MLLFELFPSRCEFLEAAFEEFHPEFVIAREVRVAAFGLRPVRLTKLCCRDVFVGRFNILMVGVGVGCMRVLCFRRQEQDAAAMCVDGFIPEGKAMAEGQDRGGSGGEGAERMKCKTAINLSRKRAAYFLIINVIKSIFCDLTLSGIP